MMSDSKMPDGLEELDTVYSNFDHRLEEDIAKQLEEKSGKAFAQHAAYNFCGYIWHADGKWHDEVWVHGAPVHVYEGDTIKAVIEAAVDQHGGE